LCLWRGWTGTSHRFTTSQMHTQTILVFLAIKLPENSNKILKTDLFKEIDFWKSFWKSIAQTRSHWECQFYCLWFWLTGASFDYYKWYWTRYLKTIVQVFFYRKKVLKKGHEMHSGCLESRMSLNEKALSLDRFEFASKSLK